ncbi:MAG: nitronate monooxygenase [Gordonia sp. (in: high G+C Gram-positive bacteria)]
MLDLTALTAPIVGAPMAGGCSTVRLTAAVSEAGGLGFHAGAYLSAEGLRADIAEIRALTDAPFGVNLFVPEEIPFDADAFTAFRARLLPLADRAGVALPETLPFTDDHFAAKAEVLLEERVAAVSFTFGAPAPAMFAQFAAAGILTVASVTSVDEALTAQRHGAAALCAQGVQAGGHRATFHITDDDPAVETLPLVRAVVEATGLPTIGSGGVSGPGDVAALLDAGAVAAQVGTVLLRTPEAGTKPAHREALANPRFTSTATTRAYSGRLARGLVNGYIRTLDDDAPAVYPQINTLTGPVRRALADDPEVLNLWAGTGWRGAREETAREVVARLSGA